MTVSVAALTALEDAEAKQQQPTGTLTYLEHGPALPGCAKCGTYVEKLTWYYDQFRCQRVYIAECHGAKEEVRVDDHFLMDRAQSMSMGEAFRSDAVAALPEAAQ